MAIKKLYVVDVSSLFFRAFFAIPHLSNEQGMPTNALYGFLSMTVKLLRSIKPDYLAFCFDVKEPSFRSELFPEYKAHREEMPADLVPQVPYVKKITDALGIARFEKPGFEADDLIGALVEFGRRENLEVVIVSGDKDFTQLIGPMVTMYDTMKEVHYDEEAVLAKWGVRPNQMIDYLALVGDSSDNIPGVKGVGPKTAVHLLQQYKNLDGIYDSIEKITSKSVKTKLLNSKDMAYLSQKLVTIPKEIDWQVNLADLKLREVNRPVLKGLLEELSFKSFERGLLGEDTDSVDGAKELPEVVNWSLKDLEENLPKESELWVFALDRGIYLGFKGQVLRIDGVDPKDVGRVLSVKDLRWLGYDLKEAFKVLGLGSEGVSRGRALWDQMLASYVLRPRSVESLAQVYQETLSKKIPELASPEQVFACHLELFAELKKRLVPVNGEKILNEMELPLIPILVAMEDEGIGIDVAELNRLSLELETDIAQLEGEIHSLSGESFNVASPKQLANILFDKLGLPKGKKTKTGYSTGSEVLEKLATQFPIARLVLDYRELSKLKSTYVDALPQLVNSKTGRIHTHFRQAATTTGRLSSFNPNLQNIPVRTERGRQVRRAFVARQGCVFISADYSQVELRILAHITGDEGLCKAFSEDLDIHQATASEIFLVPLDEVTPELRRAAKAVNFGIAYGQGAYGLSESLNIGRVEAQDIIDRYFRRFSRVKEYMDESIDHANRHGYVETLFGRRRYIEELKSKNGNIRRFGERAAINAPIQGTASDIMKLVMIDLDAHLDIPMLLQVHDEILFEAEESVVDEAVPRIIEIMEGITDLKVPLKVNVSWRKNWLEG